MPWIGHVPLDRLHLGVLQPWIDERRRCGQGSVGTINHGLQDRPAHPQSCCCGVDGRAGSDLVACGAEDQAACPITDKRAALSAELGRAARLFRELPDYLAEMALFAVNTGCRDGEICGLRWDWEVDVPELGTSVFIIPGSRVKNGDDRLVVLNRVALSVVEARRGIDPTYRLHLQGPTDRSHAHLQAGCARETGLDLPQVRVHDLKHTFGRRLRAAGVSFEDRQDLLGHRSGRITTHYSAAELVAADRGCQSRV